jgi:nucleotide-binding universal stress UspA family protein
MKRILIPCDFSTTAQRAYTFALDIAKRNNSEVFVLNVLDIPFMYDSYSVEVPTYLNPQLWKELEDRAREEFNKMKSTHSFQDVTFRMEQGQVTMTVLDFIGKENIDLVVMGTSGATGLDEYLIGSNTEKIVRFAKVPVFAVRKAVNLASIKNIVVPTTLALDQTAFITKLKEMQAFFGAELHFLLINKPSTLKRSKDQKAEMEEFVKHYKIDKYTLNMRDDFTEEAGILGFAKETKADMIAMATHGRSGLARLFSGSITEDVVNHVECPIWTYSLRK